MNGSGNPSDKHLFGTRDQPLFTRDHVFLKPSLPYVRPVYSGRKSLTPKNNSGSPDFIPLSSSSPNNSPTWKEFMKNSYASGSSSTPWNNPNVSKPNYNYNPSTPKNNSGSLDFIPLSSSSPNRKEFMNNSYASGSSSTPWKNPSVSKPNCNSNASCSSSNTPWKTPNVFKPNYNPYFNSTPSRANSSFNYNPLKRNRYWRNSTRGRRNINRSNLKSCHISEYISQSMFEDPWAELEKKLKEKEELEKNKAIGDSEEESQNSAVV